MANALVTRIGRALAAALPLPRFLLAVLASRLALLALLDRITGGQELSNDTVMHMRLVRQPLAQFTYALPDYEQLPPLQPLLEAAIGWPLQRALPDFWTLRLVMIGYEVLLALLLDRLLGRLGAGAVRRGLVLGAYLALPMGWMTSTVMAQDDPIGGAMVLAALLLMADGRPVAALLLCGAGVVAGKLFLGLELLTLLAFCRGRRLLAGAAAGFAPILLVYGGMTAQRLAHGYPLPLLHFRPNPYFGTNFWLLLRSYAGVDLHAIGPASGVVALAAALAPALLVRRAPAAAGTPARMAAAVAASTLIFYSLFYHINPEYFLLATPPMLLTATGPADAVYCALVAALPWAGKFFQNAQYMHAVALSPGKLVALRYFQHIFGSSPEYWLAGTQALCSLLTLAASLRWCRKLAPPPPSPRRVLVYRLGSLGDMVVALPALHLIARAFPEAERRLLTSVPAHAKAPPAAAVLDHTGLIHGYLRYRPGSRSPRALAALWWQVVRWRPEVLVYLGGVRGLAAARRDDRFFRLCGIRRRIGVPASEDMQFPRPSGGGRFEAEAARLVRNLAALGAARLDDPASWGLHLTAAEQARAAAALAPAAGRALIAASLGTKRQANDWGCDNWRAVFARLAARWPGHALVLCGAAEEAAASAFAAAGWQAAGQGPALNLCGALTPRESAAVLGRAVLFLGHDSGPTHLAAAMQVPCVAVYSARNRPGVWFPYGGRHRVLYRAVACAGCRLETCIAERKRCILSITVEEVLAAAAEVMDGTAAPGPPPGPPPAARALT
jgi:heptosyltransferase III